MDGAVIVSARSLPRRAQFVALVSCMLAAAAPHAARAAPGDTVAVSAGDTATLSPDGRYVGFRWNGTASDHFGPAAGVWMLDRSTGAKTAMSTAATDWEPQDEISRGNNVAISSDGRYAAFMSQTYRYFDGRITIYRYEVLVRDRQTGVTEHIAQFDTSSPWSPNGATSSFKVALSGDGRYVVFDTYAPSLVPGDTNGVLDVFLYDRSTKSFSRISRNASGTQGNGHSLDPAITRDGRYVAYLSGASNLVAGDTNGAVDVFLFDRRTATTQRVNLDANGQQVPGAPYSNADWVWYAPPALSNDARFVAFASPSAALVPGDTNQAVDLFVRDRVEGSTERVNVGPNGEQANRMVRPTVSLSGDGRYVAFSTSASNIVPGDTNDSFDVFVRDRATGKNERASVTSDGAQFPTTQVGAIEPALSADGRFVAFDADYKVYVHENGGTKVYALKASPGVADFGAQTIFTRSPARTYTFSNAGTMPLPIVHLKLRGVDLNQFVLTSHCPETLEAGSNCKVDVAFKPDAVGLKQAELMMAVKVAEGQNNQVVSRALSGTGVLGQFELQPSSLWFGAHAVGTTSGAKYVVVRNTGASVLPVRAVALGGPNPRQFTQADDCPSVLPAGGSCKVGVRFVPTSAGAKRASLTVWVGGGAGSGSVGLNGTGD